MVSDNSHPVTLHGQTVTLALQATKLRDALQKLKPRDLPANTIQDLTNLADRLSSIGQKIEAFETEHSNMQALAQIGSVVNSSLELDEVLRIVMDNIVRLTHAERGFLVLRNEKGEMVTQVARNWEQESIKSAEAATSRTIVQRVVELRRADHHHECAARSALQRPGKHRGAQPAIHLMCAAQGQE